MAGNASGGFDSLDAAALDVRAPTFGGREPGFGGLDDGVVAASAKNLFSGVVSMRQCACVLRSYRSLRIIAPDGSVFLPKGDKVVELVRSERYNGGCGFFSPPPPCPMAITVVCPGCMKRFQVGDRFAGQKGPCPNCNTVINIPKAEVKVHAPDDFAQGGKTAKGRSLLKPIERINADFDPMRAAWITGGTLGVVFLAWLIGRTGLSVGVRDVIGFIGLLLIGFPLALFGYYVTRDREELFVLTGMDLYQKAAICAGAYAVLWIFFETLVWYTSANAGDNTVFLWIYFAVTVAFAMFAAHAIFDISSGQAMFHALVFFVSVLLLRGLMDLGWLWESSPGQSNTETPWAMLFAA